VSYRLGPRINAAGRVGDAETALRLLLTDDRAEARRLAQQLEDHNRERRAEDRRVQREAEARLARDYDPDTDRAVVVWGEDWHPGVIGVAASRLVDRVHRPAVLLTFREGPVGRGSGRSVPGFDLHAALAECDGLLERFGGHRRAAGLEIRREHAEAFAARLDDVARRELDPGDLAPRLRLDLEVPLGRVDGDLHRWLRHLAPFGAGNPGPVLVSRPVRFVDVRRVGAGDEHLKATLAGPDGGRLPAIGFGLGDRAPEAASGGDGWEVAYELAEDVWRGRRRLLARLKDLRPAGGTR
jgi:single-stranded-DNA-specific exonuclease